MATKSSEMTPEQELLATALKRLDRRASADSHNRTASIDDLKFVNGEQWDSKEKKSRLDKGRPALQVNLLPKFIEQVWGDMLHNTPSIKVRPADSKGDVNIAKIRQGIISGIEYNSKAKSVYGYGGKQMVTCGYGAWRVLTRYADDNPFLQEIYIESVRNPFLVYMGPSKDQNFADAQYGFILERIPKEEFKERFPKAKDPSAEMKTGQGLSNELWYDADTCTIAEYFSIEKEKKVVVQLEDGRVATVDEFDEMVAKWDADNKMLMLTIAGAGQLSAPPPEEGPLTGAPTTGDSPALAPGTGSSPVPTQEQPSQVSPISSSPGLVPGAGPAFTPELLKKAASQGSRPKYVNKREVELPVVRQWIISGCEILEGGISGKQFPGKYIPIILVVGRELNIEGKNYVYSLIRHAKDPQKMYNYWNTAAAEVISLSPKSPWLGTAKMFEGFEEDYAKANVENLPFLKFNPDDNMPGGAPARQQPGAPPIALFEQIRRGEENVKSVLGLFGPDVGEAGSEQTGAAVTARQRPGDIGTFEFSQNWTQAIEFTGKVINEMIPTIYDTERDVRIRHFDDTESFVPVNTTSGNALDLIERNPTLYKGVDTNHLKGVVDTFGRDVKLNDLTIGKYNVVVTTGPSYATQRQESTQHLLQLVSVMPQQMSIAADIIVRNMDFKDSEELANRLKKGLPPGIIEPKPGDPPVQPPITPEVMVQQLKTAAEEAKKSIADMKTEREQMKLEREKLRTQWEIAKIQGEVSAVEDPAEKNGARIERHQKLAVEAERVQLERDRFNAASDKDKLTMLHNQIMDLSKLELEHAKLKREERKVLPEVNDSSTE